MSKEFILPYAEKYGKVTVHDYEDAKGILMISRGEVYQTFLQKQDDSLKSILLWPCEEEEASSALQKTYGYSVSPFAENAKNIPSWLKTLSVNLGADCEFFQFCN